MKIIKTAIPWIALGVAIVSALYARSGVQLAEESNRIALEAQTETRELFLVEKRPYINVYIPEFDSGEYLMIDGATEPTATYQIELKNDGGIAARNIEIAVHFFDDQGVFYNTMTISVPDLQKILPNKSHSVRVSMTNKTGTPIFNAIKSGRLQFQAEIRYKSDVDNEIQYKTRKQFAVEKDGVILLGTLGEFE